jgi:hypothetical protein
MKKSLFTLILIVIHLNLALSQYKEAGKDPAGQWKFSAPYAPEGFNTGTMSIGFTEQKYSVSMAFTGGDYSFTGEDIKFRNDSLLFSIYIEDAVIDLGFKMENGSKMTGSASTPDGPIPVNVERAVEPE